MSGGNGKPSNGNGSQQTDLEALAEEAALIRDALRELHRRASSLHQALRVCASESKKREKAVEQTLAGLKGLQKLAV